MRPAKFWLTRNRLFLSGAPSQRATAVGRTADSDERAGRLHCEEGDPLCAETADAIGYEGRYTGHDKPSLLFYSDKPGTKNDVSYRVVVPRDPPVQPRQDGRGGTFNFQDRVALWFGMALCDNQSGPEFTHAPCTPNSDSNIFDGADPTKPDYLGRHPGTAFLELQFYPPGWAPFGDGGISCDATRWCAAIAVFSFNQDQNTGTPNNADCLAKVGVERRTSRSSPPAAGRTRRRRRSTRPRRPSRPTRPPTCLCAPGTSSTSPSTTRATGWSPRSAVGKELGNQDARYLALAVRICAELGADMVKTYYTEGFESIVESAMVPVVVAGGKKLDSVGEALSLAGAAVRAGVAGIDFGRNVWQSDHPVATIRSLRAVVHDGLGDREALDLYERLAAGERPTTEQVAVGAGG